MDELRKRTHTAREVEQKAQEVRSKMEKAGSLDTALGADTNPSEDEDMGFHTFLPSMLSLASAKTRAKRPMPVPPMPQASAGGEGKLRKVSKPGSAPSSLPSTPASSALGIRTPEPLEPEPQEPEAKPRDKKSMEKLKKAREFIDAKKKAFSDENLWEGKMKSRAFQSLSTQMEQNAHKIRGIDTDEPEVDFLVELMLDFSEKVNAKYELFQKMKKDPANILGNMESEDLDVFCSLSPALFAKIVIWLGNSLLKNAEDNSLH